MIDYVETAQHIVQRWQLHAMQINRASNNRSRNNFIYSVQNVRITMY